MAVLRWVPGICAPLLPKISSSSCSFWEKFKEWGLVKLWDGTPPLGNPRSTTVDDGDSSVAGLMTGIPLRLGWVDDGDSSVVGLSW